MVLGLQPSECLAVVSHHVALFSAHLTFIKAQTTMGTWRLFLSGTGCSEQLTLPQENGNSHPPISITVALSLESALHLDHKEMMSPFGMQANPHVPVRAPVLAPWRDALLGLVAFAFFPPLVGFITISWWPWGIRGG